MKFVLLTLGVSFAIASPAFAQCALILPGPGFHHGGVTYVISRNAYDSAQGLETEIRSEYGASARLADWQELKQALGSGLELREFIAETGLPLQPAGGPCNNILVSNAGTTQIDGYMIFLARHDGTPQNWFVIDTIGNHAIDLGRFYYHSQALIALPDDEVRTPENAIATRLAELLILLLAGLRFRQNVSRETFMEAYV